MAPEAGTSYAFSMVKTWSGWPISQPSMKFGTGGRSLGLPSGAPLEAQRISVSFSASVSRRSFEKIPRGWVACHGGIWPSATFSLMDFAQGRVCSYVSSDMGAISPGRWQVAQFLYRIGATSEENVGIVSAANA